MQTDDGLIPASTILMVRNRPLLEVMMVERHHQIDFASGALVFPGGKLAKEDYEAGWGAHVDAPSGLSARELAFRIAAVREAFEESGLLLARPKTARGLGAALAGPEATDALIDQRDAIAAGKASFLDAIATADLALAVDTLAPFAHWVTPKGMPKRFDTWFYIAAAPDAQAALCDGLEAVDAVWLAPGDALAQAERGERKIIFPTRLNVELLGRSRTADDALAHAATRRIVTVEPQIVKEESGLVLTIPEEAGYAVTREPLEPNMP